MLTKRFSKNEQAGQRLMVGFDGTALTSDLKFLIDTVCVGGIILFSRNIDTPTQMAELCRSAQDHALSCGRPPLFIALDQEGGKVARLPTPLTKFAGNPTIKSVPEAIAFATITANELKEVGVNMNMAPVLDIAFEQEYSIMADRAFGDDPKHTAKLGTAVIDQFQQNRIMAVAKHFPGIGRTTLDSHIDRPYLDTSVNTLQRSDLVPFATAIQHNVAGIMLSHTVYEKIDAKWPASLSPHIVNDLLRGKMGYEGLVLTDDLDMGAIKKYYDIDTVAAQLMATDIDQILICHRSPDIEAALEKMIALMTDIPSQHARSQSSVERILSFKKAYIEGE